MLKLMAVLLSKQFTIHMWIVQKCTQSTWLAGREGEKKIFIFNVSINCCGAVPNYSVYTDTKQKRAGEKKAVTHMAIKINVSTLPL